MFSLNNYTMVCDVLTGEIFASKLPADRTNTLAALTAAVRSDNESKAVKSPLKSLTSSNKCDNKTNLLVRSVQSFLKQPVNPVADFHATSWTRRRID